MSKVGETDYTAAAVGCLPARLARPTSSRATAPLCARTSLHALLSIGLTSVAREKNIRCDWRASCFGKHGGLAAGQTLGPDGLCGEEVLVVFRQSGNTRGWRFHSEDHYS